MKITAAEDRLGECSLNPPVSEPLLGRLGAELPKDYCEFLLVANGLEGFVTLDAYLFLWPLEDIQELNETYLANELLPGVTLIGTNGGDVGYGYDITSGCYIGVPLVGMSREEMETMGRVFSEFLDAIAEQ